MLDAPDAAMQIDLIVIVPDAKAVGVLNATVSSFRAFVYGAAGKVAVGATRIVTGKLT
jgi:hypothetical protein